MTRHQANKLRDEIQAEHVYCTIPRDCKGPKFVARIFTVWGEISFENRDQWLEYKRLVTLLRTPISRMDRLIDDACGHDARADIERQLFALARVDAPEPVR